MHDFRLGFVFFENAEDTRAVLRKRYHRIEKYIVAVDVANEETIRVNMANCSPNRYLAQFSDMNDATMLKIFNCLSITDLCGVAKTCMRFKKVADHSFTLKTDEITWRAGDLNARQVFQSFGHLITRLDIDITAPEDCNFELLTQVCSTRLRQLSLWMNGSRYFSLNKNTIVKLKILFSHLQYLRIHCCEFFNLATTKELMISCVNLESLTISCTSFACDEWNHLNIRFPKLQELKFHLNSAINDTGLHRLLALNRNIRRLYLDECTALSSNAIRIIVNILPNLEEISLGLLQNIHPVDLQPLGQLIWLTSLVIILDRALPLINVFRVAKIPIENLELWYVNINNSHIESISDIPSITKLILSRDVQDSHLPVLAANLPLLNELRLGYSAAVTVQGLENMLFHAHNLTSLTLTNIKWVKAVDKQRLLDFAKRYDKKHLTIEID